jgi:hypothetical protein
MRFKDTMAACVIAGTAVAAVYAQAPTDAVLPSFRATVVVRPTISDFNVLLASYFLMRTGLEAGLPARRMTDSPAENIRAEHALARRIREARDNARRGDIFTPAISAEFRRILRTVTEPRTQEAIGDDNPGSFAHSINGTYPKRRPLSTMPGLVLRVLPPLPDGVEYRFIGNDLILHDTHANVILDRMPCAIACVEVVR